ncbi:hypothetical protein MZO42_07310 [Sphingomonas psychrotolerans]|uniref:SIMPL domain-containing protein n=1 Tax=Sphingomonas psychrotolerans TaxID=1327635 RepID=A0ABU3N2N6_9SPHN|nr:hypothetical protein [Sphingomonas psychrotolerans]MDT8758501.1 hypothetical protein [Sphingomonas psychrotolerans]
MRRGLATLALAVALVPLPGGGAQASGGGGAGAGGLNLVAMDEVVVPIIEADRLSGNMRFKLVLEAHDAATAAKATAEMPALRETIVATGLEFARLNASGLRAVDAGRLDHDLNAAIKAAEPGVSRVLIVEIAASYN